jgi:ribosomal protein S18 acetylase RimI-like enzyme
VTQGFRIEALSSAHDRKNFSSGVGPLDRYLRDLAAQDVKRRVSNCFVALGDGGAIAGYYTLAAASFPLTDLPKDMTKRLPHYALLPAALVGRLAIDQRFQGHRLGSALVMDAVARAARSESAIFALIVDAKDDAAIAFYQHLKFQRFASKPMSLFLPIATALEALHAKSENVKK